MNLVKPIVFGVKLANRWKSNSNHQNATWIRKELTHMGPAYIKLGQLIATRNDIFPTYLTNELELLYDKVNPVVFNDIRDVIESELNNKMHNLFVDFSEEPISSASIGQVHLATLQEYPNSPVVVKVQRPNVAELFQHDFNVMINVTKFIKYIVPNNKQLSDIYDMIVQCQNSILKELDYVQEVHNTIKLRKSFTDTYITVPRVVKRLSTQKVIIMEYIPSKKLSTSTTNIHYVTRTMVKNIMIVAMKHGIIHGDLHPGNVGITDDFRVVLYDCGLIIHVNNDVIRILFSCILTNDADRLMNTLVDNNLVYIDHEVIGRVQLRRIVEYVFEYVNTLNLNQFMINVQTDPMLCRNKLFFHIDTDLFLLSRTMALLEGTCKSIDSDFTYTDIILDMITDVSVINEYLDISVLINKSMIDFARLSNPNTLTNNSNESYLRRVEDLLSIQYQTDNTTNMFVIFLVCAIIMVLNI